jgi:hypothetical protein
MATEPDPYHVLGLERGASLDEVKKAYRRLAKANHPDAAGEAALPRFLAIQAAYDRIAGPDAGNRRVVGRRPGSPARGPWEADADRAGATYRAYGGRPRPRPGPRPGPRPRAAPRPDRQERSDRQQGTDPNEGADRPPKKATLGSTSYDDVDPETFAPDWGGASWYGTTSGTYWTLNPKEYADPRKHGPEYQARARRTGSGPTRPAEGADASGAAPPPTHTTSSWWEATAGDPEARTEARAEARTAPRTDPRDRTTDAAAGPPETPPAPPAPPGDGRPLASDSGREGDLSTDAVLSSFRAWLDEDHPPIGARIGRAVVGWAPIALGMGWGAGEISGCGRFSATCEPAVAPATWGVQIALLVLLMLLPRLARVATVATIGTLATVFPASVLLFATGSPEGMATGRTILGALMVIAWTAGLIYGVVREFGRRGRPLS